ncbi:MAG: glycosyltransferase family 2 protein [Panacagrimonas sp.]
MDDGSGPECAAVLDALEREEVAWLNVLRHTQNAGKGVAVRTGFEAAGHAGHTHAVQIDADGQHDVRDIPRMLELSRQSPCALVTGTPVYDGSVPRSRLYGRWVTHLWVWVHTLSTSIRDSMCGFRVYPLEASLRICRTQTIGSRMDFDTEIMVRMYWEGTPVIGTPTHVRYPVDGVSHFALFMDNLRISRMHTRLFFGMLWRLPRLVRRKLASPRRAHA